MDTDDFFIYKDEEDEGDEEDRERQEEEEKKKAADEMSNFFFYDKNITELILFQMDDATLSSMCKALKEINNICKQDYFWKIRGLEKFGDFFLQKGKEKWKDHYVQLSNEFYMKNKSFEQAIKDGDLRYIKIFLNANPSYHLYSTVIADCLAYSQYKIARFLINRSLLNSSFIRLFDSENLRAIEFIRHEIGETRFQHIIRNNFFQFAKDQNLIKVQFVYNNYHQYLSMTDLLDVFVIPNTFLIQRFLMQTNPQIRKSQNL